MPIRCELISQDRIVFQGDVDIVILPGSAGELGILPHHSPLLTTLDYGIIKVRQGEREQVFAVAGGLAEILPDNVTILADAAENADEIDVVRAEAAKKRAETALASAALPEPDKLFAEAALRRSTLRLDVVKRHRKAPPLTERDISM